MRESAAASAVWRHLTHPDGMTVSLLVAATGLGVISYLAAFALALKFDQPFAPVQVAVLLVLAAGLRMAHAVTGR